MAIPAAIRRWRPGLRTWVLGGLAALLLVAITTLAVTTYAWGDTLREEGRLLPGSVVATVDVGGMTVEEAVAAVEDELDEQLDRTVTVTHGDEAWETTPRELGATSDVDQVVSDALDHTSDAGLTQLARLRWAGASADVDLGVSMGIPDEEVEAFVDDIADELDREPREAEVSWTGAELDVAEHRDGLEVQREEAVEELRTALDDGETDEVALATQEPEPEVTTADARATVDTLGPAIEGALDHRVTAVLDGDSWSTSPRELDASPNLGELLEVAFDAGPEAALDDLRVQIPDDAVSGFVASIAADVDVAARNAEAEWTGSDLSVTPEREGLALNRDAAREDVRSALRGDAEQVELSQTTTTPSITADSLGQVIVLDQSERQVSLYEGDQVVAEYPVAVGLADSPTPTGQFTVGAMRHEPVWTNPAPDRWGADMPARIGPGPDNPLGPRAINWNDNGRDTLIRFHGTPNEDSIGEAASAGCVRMFNEDVIELYDQVSTGTVIVSVG